MRAKEMIRRRWRLSRRGQSLVEFALVLPMLIVLFLGIADFGRVFAAGITVEAIARNAAEIVAGDTRMARLKDVGCDMTCRSALYTELHQLAAATALSCTSDIELVSPVSERIADERSYCHYIKQSSRHSLCPF